MIFNVTGGGSGSGGTLVVTAPAGVTCTVSKDGKTKTKTVDQYGYATFKGLDGGTWTVTIIDDTQSVSKSVVIVTDYATTLSFASPINLTYFAKGNPYPTATPSYTDGSYDFSNDTLKGYVTSSAQKVCVVSKTTIDFSNIKQIKFKYNLDKALSGSAHLMCCVATSNYSAADSYQVCQTLQTSKGDDQQVTLDTSNANGSYYLWLGLVAWGSLGTVNFEIFDLQYVEG